MTLAELGHSFRGRLARKASWGAFALVLGLWACFTLYRWSRGMGWHEPFLQLLSGFLFFFAFIWLAPLPWQWDGEPGLRRAGGRQFLQAFLASEILIVLMVGFEELLARGLFGSRPYPFALYLMNLCFQGPALFLVGLMHAQQDRLTQAWLASRRQAEEATSQQLKGQLHPHALFNSLNGLAELIGDDPAGAEVFVEAMSGFLRRVLEASRCTDWGLEEERRLAEDYLVMEGMRLGPRLQVAWEWDHSLDRQLVSPLLVQPLLENALKHGINGCESGGRLKVVARREGADLLLQVGNTGAKIPPQAERRAGTGLQNLRRRLDLAYGTRAEFHLRGDAEAWTWASIRIALFASAA